MQCYTARDKNEFATGVLCNIYAHTLSLVKHWSFSPIERQTISFFFFSFPFLYKFSFLTLSIRLYSICTWWGMRVSWLDSSTTSQLRPAFCVACLVMRYSCTSSNLYIWCTIHTHVSPVSFFFFLHFPPLAVVQCFSYTCVLFFGSTIMFYTLTTRSIAIWFKNQCWASWVTSHGSSKRFYFFPLALLMQPNLALRRSSVDDSSQAGKITQFEYHWPL